MPLFLLPPPRRIRTSRRNFPPPARPSVWVDPRVAPAAAGAVARLSALFPGLRSVEQADASAAIRLLPLDDAPGLTPMPDLPAAAGTGERFALEVTEGGILLAAADAAGFGYGADLVAQLREEEVVVGVRVEDWPAFPIRELILPGVADDLEPRYWPRLIENAAWCRFNRLVFAAGGAEPEAARQRAAARGIQVGSPSGEAAARAAGTRLPEPGAAGTAGAAALAALPGAAAAVLAAGGEAWRVAVPEAAPGTPIDAFWFALAVAGACGWNPAKAELRVYRRAFAARFFGAGAGAVQEAIDALDRAATAGNLPIHLLFEEDPAAPHALRRLTRAPERLREAKESAERALSALATAREHVERNAEALAALEGPARRLLAQSEVLLALVQARESYADAWVAAGNPRAVSQRLLRTAETLESAANCLASLEPLFPALRAAERRSPLPPEVWAPYALRIERLRDQARELRETRNTYIQTGTLPEPAAVGLASTTGAVTGARHPGRAVAPARLPPRPSPEWWPEGGEARLRIETDGRGVPAPPGAVMLPWEIAVDLRAWAGSEGAFHVGRVRLVEYDDAAGAVGRELPCQLTRGGLVATLAGGRAYYLYLERRGESRRETAGPAPGDAESRVRARQSAGAIVLESALQQARVERAWGLLDRWAATPEPGRPSVEIAGLMGEPPEARERPARARVVENGPLLARVEVEDGDGRVRQYDFHAGLPAWEWASSVPVARLANRLMPEAWPDAALLFPGDRAARPLAEAEGEGDWAARLRPDGLALAALCPEGIARHSITLDRHDVESDSGVTRLAWWLLRTDATPAAPEPLIERLNALVAALRRPPTIHLGPVEERRAREF